MQDKANTDSQDKPEGEISDRRVQQPQDERTAVRTRAFTRWMNVFLQRRDPPVEVHNLFTDIQDGRILMALLEELSGCKLLYRFRASSHRIFRLNNISKALAFLDDRHVKLLGIDASGIADGLPAVVLNLIWNMILFFQVKEVTGGLQRHLSSSLSSLSMSSYPSSGDLSPQPNDIGSFSCSTLPSKGRKAARKPKYHGKAIKTLLQWVQRCTSKFGVDVHDFGKSWRSGLAFLALIKSLNPALVDLRESLSREPRENIQLAFTIASHSLDIPPLLEPEDVLGTSPDERSIITYVSMFLTDYSGTDKCHTADLGVLEIPNFGSLESVSFGETLADDPEAQALLQGMEKSSEQGLWKQWARRSSGSPRTTLLSASEATSPFNKKTSRSRGILQPPSPLDAGIGSPEIRSWMEKASVEQSYSKPRVDESHFSLSSEEGIYNLSALDSDEEEAYSYILDLNKEVFPPYNQLKRQVPRVEEETEEEMLLNGQQTEESAHLEIFETLNGSESKHQEGSLEQNVDSEVRAQSVVHRAFDRDTDESSSRETANGIVVFDVQPEEDSTEECKNETVVRGQSNDDGNHCEEEKEEEKTENTRLVKCGEREALVDETENTKLLEAASWKTEVEDDTDRGLFEKCGQVSEKKTMDEEDEAENVTIFKEVQDRMLGREKEEEDSVKEEDGQQSVVSSESFKVGVNEKILTDEVVCGARWAGATHAKEQNDRKDDAPEMEDLTCEDEDKDRYSAEVMNSVDSEAVRTEEEKDGELRIKRRKLTEKTATTTDHPNETAQKNDTNGGVNVHDGERWTPAYGATSPSFRAEGFTLHSSAASCDITPSELEMLVVLWILLFCCFILPQLNF